MPWKRNMNIGILFTGLQSSSKGNVNTVSGTKGRLCNFSSSVGIAARYGQDGPGFELR
jgi:hypothetical protein